MNIEQQRLFSLIEFAQHSARLRTAPPEKVSDHKVFSLHENQLRGLPGIRLNVSNPETGDEIWLRIERIHETKPPEVELPILKPWIELKNTPDQPPTLKRIVDGASLIVAGTHQDISVTKGKNTPDKKSGIAQDATISLDDYDQKNAVEQAFKTYLNSAWEPWSEQEKLRRKTVRLYSELFTLKQQLEGSIVESALELVWGVGIGIWQKDGSTISYPLVTRLVELSLDPEKSAIEVRPRDVDPKLEIDWYASVDNPGVGDLEKEGRKFFEQADITFSPFDRVTYEPILRLAATTLDANGIYWPNESKPEDRTLPDSDEKLKVTDTWVIFARPRTVSLFIQDLERLKKKVEEHEPTNLPGAVVSITIEPAKENEEIILPIFRGVSASYDTNGTDGSKSVETKDLYFPKPFNEEQVRIVQLLEISDGVVVQGPPGTGKTHTIANVICHYLALGKRILVTSMKDPALAVLQNQLPEEIRPLAISMLTSEQAGMKQFEHAIHKIASEIQTIDRSATTREINHIEESIDALHGKLAVVDRKIYQWAVTNLKKIDFDGEDIAPEDAARELDDGDAADEWIPDKLGVEKDFRPNFDDGDISRLREARRKLGVDIDYLGSTLPQIVEFPESRILLQAHQDLSRYALLKKEVESGNVPNLVNSNQETINSAQELLTTVEKLTDLFLKKDQSEFKWSRSILAQLKNSENQDLFKMFEDLGNEINKAIEDRKRFIQRPVVLPEREGCKEEIFEAVKNLSRGKSAFGFRGLIGKNEIKKKIKSIRVLGEPPRNEKDWEHVLALMELNGQAEQLTIRWNKIAPELGIGNVSGRGIDSIITAGKAFGHYKNLQTIIEIDSKISDQVKKIVPEIKAPRSFIESPERLMDIEKILKHHLIKNRLANVWVVKEQFQKVLEQHGGRIVNAIRKFLSEELGNPSVSDAQMQSNWSGLMAELSRVHALKSDFDAVQVVCERIKESGAPKLAEKLATPLTGAHDPLLPDNWRKLWRLKRLSDYLDEIDAHDEFKKLSDVRRGIEKDLTRAYKDVVVKRTWLKLSENASPSVRSALMAYLTAIQKIGKGTGKRAVRYRHDARQAASQANSAVPCWIMPHYRVSESLPPELGCFDLVIIDEASQSDLSALPSLLRAKKVLIVGDDKQVSPEGVGLEEEKVRSLMSRFLHNQVETYRPQMSPERSIYDLFKVVFATSAVMLKEHFRCVGPIIEYSKREFYNHELRPLRLPKATERLDPPLIDVYIENGYRNGDLNRAEARFIVEEIKSIVSDPRMSGRSIGVVSLLGDKQAMEIWEMLATEIGPELLELHSIACGDARTFQGKEKDIMFMSMVSAPNNVGAPLSRDTFAQRFNVAASRARDRVYLVRSVGLEHLSEADKLRRSLIGHFANPFAMDEKRVENLRDLCESPFEREIYDELTQRGFCIIPQVKVGQYRIDMVVEGHNDSRLAIECDGDRYHGPEKWSEDMHRQRVLERAGWSFWRCFASTFVRRRKEIIEELLKTLSARGVEPVGTENLPRSIHTEHRRYCGRNDDYADTNL